MSEFIEVISPQAKQQIADIMVQVDLLANKIKSIHNFQLSKTPSGADNNIKQLTNDLNQLAKSLNTVATSLGKVNEQKQKTATLTTQEKVDNSIILKQEKQKAVLTSEYAKAYEKLNTQRTIARQKLQDLIASERASNAEIRKAQKEFDVLNKKVVAADKAVGKFSEANSKINGLSRSVGNLMTAFGVGTGLYLAVDIVKGIYETTKALQSMDLALKMVSETPLELAKNQQFVTETAEKWGLEIKTLQQTFTQFYTASKGLLTDDSIKTTFEGIAKAGSIMGLSLEQQQAAFYAIDQMMSKGTVTAEELKKQLGNAMPGAIKAAAMAYMELHPAIKSIQEAEKALYADMKKGAIDSATYVPLIAKNFQILYGIEALNSVHTMQAAQNRLKNTWTDLIRSMNESNNSGLAKFLNSTMKMLGNFVDFTKLLFKDEQQLQTYFQNFGRMKGVKEYDEIMNNIKNTSKENIELTKKELLFRERETKRVNLEIVKSEQEKRKSIIGGDRALFHLQTKAEEDALVQIGKSQAIIDELTKKTGIKPKAGGAPPAKTQAQIDAEIEANAKANEKKLKAIEDAAKTEYNLKISNLELQKQLAQEEIDLANAVTQNKEIQYQDVVDATNYYNAILLSIEKAKYDEEVRLAKDNAKEKEIAYNKWFVSVMKLTKESNESLLKVTRDFAKEGNDVAKKMLSDFEENAKAFEEIDKRMTQGKIDNDKESLEAQRKTFNEFMGTFADKMGLGESFELFGQLDEDGETYFTKLLDAEDKTKAYFLAISTAAQDALNIVDQADEERYQRRLARLDKEEATALKYAGDGAAAKAKIEADFDKKRKELELKEFKRKQRTAIANIAIDTAQAIMAVVAKSGQLWQSIAVGALGAIQIAKAASQKPPEYWKGTDNAEAGLAWTQERGAEIVLDKHDRIKSFGSDGGAQLTMMEKGDKVINAEKTKRMMFNNELNSIMMDNEISNAPKIVVNSGMTKAEMREVMIETLGGQPKVIHSVDKNGFNTYISNNGNITRRAEQRGSGNGITV